MEILIAAVVVAVGLVAAASLLARRSPGFAGPTRSVAPASPAPPSAPPRVAPSAEVAAAGTTTEDGKSAERRAGLLRLEARLRAPAAGVATRLSPIGAGARAAAR